MTRNTKFLTDIVKEEREHFITSGGGAKRRVVGVGCLNVLGLSKIIKVLLIDGLQVNLLSISEICGR